MNTSHRLIDQNTFSVTKNNTEEVIYKTEKPIEDFDAFRYAFTENQIEYYEQKIFDLLLIRHNTIVTPNNLRSSIKRLKKINKRIKGYQHDLANSEAVLTSLVKENGIKEIIQTKKLSKKI